MGPEYRDISQQELVTSAELNLSRLVRGVDAMDGGEAEGILDVTHSLRQLIAHGEGNRLLQRVADALGHQEPRIAYCQEVSDQRDGDDRDLRFALAALPFSQEDVGVEDWSTLEEFLNMKCLLVASPRLQEEVTYSWDGLISVVANKLGPSHTDDQRRKILDELNCYMVCGEPALRYALRTAGAAVATAGAELLLQIGRSFDRKLPLLHRTDRPAIYGALIFGGLDTGHVDLRFAGVLNGYPASILGYDANADPEWLFRPPLDIFEKEGFERRFLGRVSRNDPCPCGSGQKYKKCHGR